MVATLGAAQGNNSSTTLEVSLINCDYQLLWLKIVENGKMQLNLSDMLQSPILVVEEKKDNKLDSSSSSSSSSFYSPRVLFSIPFATNLCPRVTFY